MDKVVVKLLLIDNNTEEALFLKEMLSGFYEYDFDVFIAKSFKEAMAVMREGVDVVLTEITLPDCPGLEPLRLIRKICRNVPILVLTDKYDKINAARAMMFGAFEFLIKRDLSPDEIYKSIKYSLERKLQNNSENYNILLIDDNNEESWFIRKLISEVKDFKHTLIHKNTLSEALELLNKAKERVDVILTDLVLPDSMGIETLTSIVKQASQIPVIVLTSLEDEELALESIANGAQDFLQKGTFNFELISRVVRYAIERKNKENQLKTATEKLKRLTKEKIETEQLKAVTALMVTQNHELNQPLSIIMSQSQLLRTKLAKGMEITTANMDSTLEKIEKATKRMAVILKELNNIKHIKFEGYANDPASRVLNFGANTGLNKESLESESVAIIK